MSYRIMVANQQYHFADLKTLMAKATPLRSGDELAGIAALDATERVAAQMALADVPLKTFLNETVVDYDIDEITRLIIDEHNQNAFAQFHISQSVTLEIGYLANTRPLKHYPIFLLDLHQKWWLL